MSRVVVAGGGVAGIEALLALHDLAGERAELTLVNDGPDFLYKPLLVEEPFGLDPAVRRELAPLAEKLGADLVQGRLASVEAGSSEIELADGTRVQPAFQLLASNDLKDYTLSSVAIKDGQLFLRTAGWLWAIGERRSTAAR